MLSGLREIHPLGFTSTTLSVLASVSLSCGLFQYGATSLFLHVVSVCLVLYCLPFSLFFNPFSLKRRYKTIPLDVVLLCLVSPARSTYCTVCSPHPIKVTTH